ncbi:MAG: Na/Pi cotransporter family protein [Bacteroidales bacterium]|nr:Na/Pi cotransporter family protein [Bacteroidales bacterium]
MTSVAIISSILTLIAGVGVFLIACQMLSNSLESAGSNKLKSLFSKASSNRWLGVGIGTVGTAAIQSSSAVTVMVIGFVNAGILSLAQAATVIYGANIGTTVTAQIVALGMSGKSAISTSLMFSTLTGIGAFISLFAKQDMAKKIGGVLTGFGMLFVGLAMMSGAMKEFSQLDSVKVFLSSFQNPIVLVLMGALLTALIQSSSVMTSIALTMVVTGLVNLEQGIYISMGSNIGTCVSALMACMASGRNAKRAALIHLFFNISGVIIFLIAGMFMSMFTGGSLTYGSIFEWMFPGAPQIQLAMFHTIFNVITVLIVLPLTGALVRLVTAILPDKFEENDTEVLRLHYIDDNMLSTPPIAVEQTKMEIINMAAIANKNFNRALDIICKLDFAKEEKFRHDERQLNFINKKLINFVVRLSELPLSESDHIYLASTYRTIRDLERIGDYAENIVEYAQTMRDTNMKFSDDAVEEVEKIRELINQLYEKVMLAYSNIDFEALGEANALEEKIDELTDAMEDSHIKRLNMGVCGSEAGAQYLSLSSNAERIADHFINVGKVIRTLKH